MLVHDAQSALVALVVQLDDAVNFGHDRFTLWISRFEQLFHARQTVGDVFDTRHTAGVERPQRQLGTRLANALRRDDADRFACTNQAAARQVATITLGAHAVPRFAR